jgi:hypothetical protein
MAESPLGNQASFMNSMVRGICVALLLAALTQLATAQEIPKSEYIEYEPLASPRIVGQTRASAAWHLFGDPADSTYRDVSPRDGIDDKRHDLLLGLAVRFAPYMVRNTTNIPMDFKGFITRRPSFPLYVDTWDVATARGHLLRTDIVDFAALARAPCGSASPARNAARPSDPHDDCRLLDLLHRFGPGGSAADTAAHTAEAPEQDLLHIFYFDFPGQDAASWKAEFENLVSGELPRRYETFAKVYAHPFIHEVADGLEVGAAYEFVLQYWFFYPYNDSGNKHEGDWEHVNVVAGLRDHPGAPLNAAELRDLLAGTVSQDRLVIGRVEYYFHHNVYLIDYTTPNVYQPRAAWAAEVGRMRPERLGEARVWAQIRNRAYTDRAETRASGRIQSRLARQLPASGAVQGHRPHRCLGGNHARRRLPRRHCGFHPRRARLGDPLRRSGEDRAGAGLGARLAPGVVRSRRAPRVELARASDSMGVSRDQIAVRGSGEARRHGESVAARPLLQRRLEPHRAGARILPVRTPPLQLAVCRGISGQPRQQHGILEPDLSDA